MYRDFTTKIVNVSVHITYAEKGGKTTLSGHAINSHTGARIDGSKTRRRVANCTQDIPSAEAHLITAVVNALPQSVKPSNSKRSQPTTNSLMHKVLENLRATNDIITSAWCEAVRLRHMTYFERNVLPAISASNDDWLPEDTDALRQQMISKVLSKKSSNSHLSDAERTVDRALTACATIYERMREVEPNLPVIDLRPRFTGRRHQNEQTKSLSRSIRRKLVRGIVKMIDVDPRIAMAAVLMFDAGLRTAEAAAVHKEEILTHPSAAISSVSVKWQAKNGIRDPVLKSPNSYRLVPLSFWGMTMVSRCLSLIGNIPIDEPLCDSHKLSAWIRNLLSQSGYSNNDFVNAEQAQRINPDCDSDGQDIYDLGAYILRRDWASRARNLCGLTSVEIDYFLGHRIKISKKARAEFRLPETQLTIQTKLERHVHDAQVSKHPGCTPYPVSHSTDFDLIPYDVIRLKNSGNEPLMVRADVTAVQCAEAISFVYTNNSLSDGHRRTINTSCMRSDVSVIGLSHVNTDDDDADDDDDKEDKIE